MIEPTPRVETLRLGESITLTLRGTDPAATWTVYPDLVDLDPVGDGKSCVAIGRAIGETTVRARARAESRARVVGTFDLVVRD